MHQTSSQIGERWYRKYYKAIAYSLGYDESKDSESRDVLAYLLSRKKRKPRLDILNSIFESKIAFLLGAGPSLDSDIRGLAPAIRKIHPAIIAADGAADVLYKSSFTPNLIVTDLDSCSMKSLKLKSQEGYVFVHAHGDNINLLKKIVPHLGGRIFGTTQVTGVESVRNFGGLTDGDRACYVVCHFSPISVVLAGMDFGSKEGRHSKNRYSNKSNPVRSKKMAWGKRSLEFLIRASPRIKFLNVTRFGEDIEGATKIRYQDVISEFS